MTLIFTPKYSDSCPNSLASFLKITFSQEVTLEVSFNIIKAEINKSDLTNTELLLISNLRDFFFISNQ